MLDNKCFNFTSKKKKTLKKISFHYKFTCRSVFETPGQRFCSKCRIPPSPLNIIAAMKLRLIQEERVMREKTRMWDDHILPHALASSKDRLLNAPDEPEAPRRLRDPLVLKDVQVVDREGGRALQQMDEGP